MGLIIDGVHTKYRNLDQDIFGGIHEDEITDGLSGGAGGYQDFSTYSKTDTNNKTALTTRNIITLTNGDRDEDYYRTKDFGTGYFGDFTHWIDVNVTSLTNNANSKFVAWALSNADDDLKDIFNNSKYGLFLLAQRKTADTHYALQLYDLNAGGLVSLGLSSAIAVGTEVFLAVSRSVKACTIQVYSTATLRASGGTGDLDTLNGNAITATTFRYAYGIGSYNTGIAGVDASGTVSNLWLRS